MQCLTVEQENQALKLALQLVGHHLDEVFASLVKANSQPGGPIVDTIWMRDGHCTVFDAIEWIAEFAKKPAHTPKSGYDPEVGFLLDAATVGELAAYDQASMECLAAVTEILDGKKFSGAGVANEPWETVRRRLINLVAENQHARNR